MAYVDFIRRNPNVADQTLSITQRADEMLLMLGLTPALKGYLSLRYAAEILDEHPEYIGKITTHLYPAIADRLGEDDNGKRVERAIRHAITILVSKKTEGYTLLFPQAGLSNAELISVLNQTIHFNN